MVRYKNRFLVFELTFEKKPLPLHIRDIYAALLTSIANNCGDYGVGMMQLSLQGMSGCVLILIIVVRSCVVLYYSHITMLGAVRCGREYATIVQACLTFITEFQRRDVKFRLIKVCGLFI